MKRERINLLGNRYGRLVVISEAKPKSYQYNGYQCFNYYWNCLCDCGNKTIVSTNCLRTKTKSCGCKQKEKARATGKSRRLPDGIAARNSLLTRYKRCAKWRGIEFNLSKEEFLNLITQACHYCGDHKKSFWRRKESPDSALGYCGVDRVNSDIGYQTDNCVPCCIQCNVAKSDYSREEFFSMVGKIYERHMNADKAWAKGFDC